MSGTFINRFRLLFLSEDYMSLDRSVTAIILPNITTGFLIQPTPMKDIFLPGDSLDISDLSVTFQLDEEYENWKVIMDWLHNNRHFTQNSQQLIVSDLSVELADKKKNMKYSIQMTDCFPFNISSIDFTTKTDTVEPLEFTVDFKVNGFTYE